MPLTINAEAGSETANSYATEAEAAAYYEADIAFGAVWALMSAEERRKRLVFGTRAIDRMNFRGYRISEEQALDFPRDIQDEPLDEIPPAVREALLEMVIFQQREAGAGAGESTASEMAVPGAVRSFRLEGALSVEFAQETRLTGKEEVIGGNWRAIMDLLAPYLGGGPNSFDWIK